MHLVGQFRRTAYTIIQKLKSTRREQLNCQSSPFRMPHNLQNMEKWGGVTLINFKARYKLPLGVSSGGKQGARPSQTSHYLAERPD